MRGRLISRGVQVVIPLIGGLLAGSVTAKILDNRARPRSAAREASLDEGPGPSPSARPNEPDWGRLGDFDRKLAALEAHRQGNPNPPGPQSVVHSPEESQRHSAEVYADFQVRAKKHSADKRDSEWAAKTERRIEAVLKEPADGTTFTYKGVDCRATTCLARFSWPSHESAKADLMTLLTALVRTQCGSSIALPPDQEGSGPLEAAALLRCREEL